jgi:RNA polymerase sigma factor (TIGR02999 family)
MSEVSVLLDAAAAGDRRAAASILPLVYDELKRLAASRMTQETASHTLSATALVHEVYLRLVGTADRPQWQGRGHFFGAAAEAMRRILVDHARRRGAAKRGSKARVELNPDLVSAADADERLLALSDALDRLKVKNPKVASLVTLRYFGGLSIPEAAATLGVSPRTADSWWAYGRAWFAAELKPD